MTNLFISLYEEKDPKRSEELYTCLINNYNSKCFDNIFILSEGSYMPALNNMTNNIFVLPCSIRPTFRTFFEVINNTTQNDDINVIANSDIYFEDFPITPQYNECLALTRYEVKKNGPITFVNRKDCTDVWVFRNRIKIPLYSDFWLGIPGCDNRINHELLSVGYKMLNPSLTFKTFHLHEGEKSYDGSQKINRPYHFIIPTE